MRSDLRREIAAYRAQRGVFSLVEVPPLQHLAIDGRGDPNTSPAYRDALAALYPVAYRVRSCSRDALDRDYTVMPLEALWWSDDLAAFTTARDKTRWEWTLLTLVPGWITAEHVVAARTAAAQKAAGTKAEAPPFDAVRLARLEEGLCVQTLHVGPYDDEAPVLAAMHEAFIPEQGLRMSGRHHEIYLNDARRTAPARLRTILRQPVVRQRSATEPA
jgi:hypothetical protein